MIGPRFYNPARNQWYVATRLLGHGGQGTVWAGYSGGLPVAIKVQTDFKAWDLEQSIHLMCFGHDFIVTTYDQFRAQDGSLILVMELAEGSAQQLVDGGTRYTAMQVCRIGADLASALEKLHAAGVRHRDITLKNVLHFGKGRFKLSDLGIARKGMAADELALTQIGTPGYFPPEVLKGEGSTPSSDVYQLGLVLLSLLLGRQILPATYTRAQIWDAIMNALPRRTAESAVATHGETARIIRNMLPRTPNLRHTSATAVRLAFEAEYRVLKGRADLASAMMSRPWVNGLSRQGTFQQIPPPPRNALAAMARRGLKPNPPVNALAALAAHPAGNGLLGLDAFQEIPRPPVSSLAAIARGVNPKPPRNVLPARGIGLEPPPPLFGIGLRQSPLFPQPPENGMLGLAAIARGGVNPNPPMMPNVKPNVALGGLLGLSSLAALAAGQKPLSGLLGLGALAALASDPNAKSSS